MRKLVLAILALAAIPAAASITVSSPSDGGQVSSPFALVATSAMCGSRSTTAMGYSLDQGATTTVKGQSINALVTSGTGEHVLHVKCWGRYGAAAGHAVNLTVGESIPSNATAVSGIQALQWIAQHDPKSGATSSGSTVLVTSPSLSGTAREFDFSYSRYGGELFHATFGKDTTATHFIYDARVNIPDPSKIANVELDMNQVMANGQTAIYSFQCDGWSGTWDYGENAGTPVDHRAHWLHSDANCLAPKDWAPGWHHVQIAYSRDDAGNITYESIVLDGERQDIGKTVPGAFALGWAPTLIVNFQLDGNQAGSASAKAYLDNVTVYRW